MKLNARDTLFAVSEIKVSYYPRKRSAEWPRIGCSKDAYEIFRANWDEDSLELTEDFYVLLLNTASKVIGIKRISSGGSAKTMVDPKLLFAVALKTFCSGLILCHNHPSGSLMPSESDIRLTKILRDGGELLGIKVWDHLIVGRDGYYSFKDEGIM